MARHVTRTLFALMMVAGCTRARPGPARSAPAVSPAPAAQSSAPNSPAATAPRTTDPTIALGNLDGQLAAARQMVARGPDNPAALAALADGLLRDGALRGRLAEYDEAAVLA